MKKLYALALLICFVCLEARATHIVGGEFELTAKSSVTYDYTLTLNLYFDDINGNPSAEDPDVNAAIFSKQTNLLMATFILPRRSSSQVNYTNPACTSSRLRTRLIQYSLDITLDPRFYNDPEGYYVVWERCCRNNGISNITSPGASGNSFYLEFPPVRVNGVRFTNSSPSFEVPKGDYACINEPFTFDFGASDPDGDRLVYTLVTPFAGFSTAANPRPASKSAPYPLVRWSTGINLSNVIPGTNPLRVNRNTGQLTLTANRLGLFVFSVLCEEYRGSSKIGEVRRDFQLMVIDCPKNDPPIVRMMDPTTKKFYVEGSVINVTNRNERCVDFKFTDLNAQERVNLTLRPLNFDQSLATLTPTSGVVNGERDTLRAKLCWADCATNKPNEPLLFEVIVSDNGCPVPKQDVLLVQMNIPPIPNTAPEISTDLPGNSAKVTDGNTFSFMVTGTDPDQDQIILQGNGRGFDMKEIGMYFTGGTAIGTVTSPFTWKPVCGKVKNGQTYIVDFEVIDKSCPTKEERAVVSVALLYEARPNQQPVISISPGDVATSAVLLKPDQEVRFLVTGKDPDREKITLYAIGRGFNLADVGMQFRSGQSGIAELTEPFYWKPDCKILGQFGSVYLVDFIVQDEYCTTPTDTITVEFNLTDYDHSEYVFDPPNVFTPNGDEKNQTFLVPNLPPNTCQDQFERIEVYNRWGKMVYTGNNREFQWTGQNFPTGVYFYLIKYTRSTYKGTVSLLR